MEELGVVCGGVMTEQDRQTVANFATVWKSLGYSEGATIAYLADDRQDYDDRVAIIKSVYASN